MAARKSHCSGHLDGTPSLAMYLSRHCELAWTKSRRVEVAMPCRRIRGVQRPWHSCRQMNAPASDAENQRIVYSQLWLVLKALTVLASSCLSASSCRLP